MLAAKGALEVLKYSGTLRPVETAETPEASGAKKFSRLVYQERESMTRNKSYSVIYLFRIFQN